MFRKLARFCFATLFLMTIGGTLLVVGGFVANWSRNSRSTDYIVFHAAGVLARHGDWSGLYEASPTLNEQRKINPDLVLPRPFPYAGTVAAVVVPLTFLPYQVAYAAVFGANLLAIAGLAFWLWRTTADSAARRTRAIVVGGVVVLGYGTVSPLFWGQWDILLTVALVASCSLDLAGRPRASVLAALPLILKPQFLPGLLLYWFREQRWFAAAGVIALVFASYLWPIVFDPDTGASLFALYRGYVLGQDSWEQSFGSSPATVVFLPIVFAAVLIAWRFWQHVDDARARWVPVFVLPLLVPLWVPRDVILVGAWGLLIATLRPSHHTAALATRIALVFALASAIALASAAAPIFGVVRMLAMLGGFAYVAGLLRARAEPIDSVPAPLSIGDDRAKAIE